MNQKIAEASGGIALIVGALLLAVYAVAFPLLLPVTGSAYDMSLVVLNPNWTWIAAIAFVGVILMIAGFTTVYSRLRSGSGPIGFLGFVFLVAAYFLQACKVTWEIFLYPVIASNPGSAFLLRDGVLKQAAPVVAFRTGSSIAIFLGIVLFCLALVRSKAYPKFASLLIFVGALVYALGPTLLVRIAGIFTHAVGCLILGLTLIRTQAYVRSSEPQVGRVFLPSD